MVQVPPHHVSRAYSEAQNKIQSVRIEASRRHEGAAGLQATAYVCLRDAIHTVATPSGVAPHEAAHVVQQRAPNYNLNNYNNQPVDIRNNNNRQEMMSPSAARTRADANLLLGGGFPAQVPIVNYHEQSGGDDRLGNLERYGSTYSESGGTTYSEP
jgi:hypothetical protein